MKNTVLFILPLIFFASANTGARHYDNDSSEWQESGSAETDDENGYDTINVCMGADGQMFTSKDKCDKRVAFGKFKNSINQTGWSFLEIETSDGYEPEIQAYAAGVAEGVLTKELIEYHIQNTVNDICGHDEAYCKRLFNYLTENMKWMRGQLLANGPGDTYWQMVNITMTQMSGIQHAFEGTKLTPSVSFELSDVFMIQLSGELIDLAKALHKNTTLSERLQGGKCTGVVKVTPGNKDMYFGHVAMSGLQTMTRVLKLIKFAFDKTKFPGHTAAFSGYPGALASADDFVLLSSGLGQTETTMAVYDKKLYGSRYIQPHNALLAWLRSIVSNTLAHSGKEWCDIMKRYNSGTYNNQWTVVDYGKFKPGQPLPTKDLVWVQEQMPGLIVSKDVSYMVNQHSYWASYNVPFIPKVDKYSGFAKEGLKYPAGSLARNWTTYEWTPRARILRRDHHKVVDMDSFTKLMRYNNFKNEEFSRCNCTPPYTAEAAMSARGDLNDPKGKYETSGMGFRNHAGLDMKGTNYAMFQKLALRAWGGPSYGGPGDLPAFQWSTTHVKAKHFGMPNLWNFQPVDHSWDTHVQVDITK